jgi:choline dehydrogenase
MGPDPLKNVVDSSLKVHGIKGLRIADASIFPELVSGNINAATIMVGEKASDLILEDIKS